MTAGQAFAEIALERFDWRAAGMDEPPAWPRALHASIAFCLAWPGEALAVLSGARVMVANAVFERRVRVSTPVRADEITLGPELASLVDVALKGGVALSDEAVVRPFMAMPIAMPDNSIAGALLLSAAPPATSLRHAAHVRDLLARVRWVVSDSARTAQSVEDYAAHLDGRIAATGRALNAAVTADQVSFDFESLLRDELTLQAAREDEDYKVDGPDVDLTPRAVEPLVLALHELATNAVKFGAFSQKNGFLSVSWKREARPGGDWFVMEWHEQGVTVPATPPPHEGFGLSFIRHRLAKEANGETSFEFRPGGVHVTLAFPLDPALQATG